MTEETQVQPRLKTLKNGAVYDLDKGRIVANPGGGKSAITPERSRELREIRAARTAARLRQKITEATGRVSALPINSSVEAVAEAGAILWEEIVLGKAEDGVYPRDRILAYKELTERAEMTSNHKRESDDKNTADAAVGAVVRELITALTDALRPRDVIEGNVTDTRNELEAGNG